MPNGFATDEHLGMPYSHCIDWTLITITVTQHSLFDNFDVHIMVSIVANCHAKVHGDCVECPLFEDVHSRYRAQRYVHVGSIHLRTFGEEYSENDFITILLQSTDFHFLYFLQ